MSLTVGSLCSGIDGLALGVERAFGAVTVWQSEIDPHGDAVLSHHWPEAPNLGDLRAVDWSLVQPVDLMCFGFPCQDISSAGRRAGIEGDASALWFDCAAAVGVLRPRYLLVENVADLLVRGFDVVLADLAAMGYVGRWGCLRSSDVGAPHRRQRIFIAATYTGGARARRDDRAVPRPATAARRQGADVRSAVHGGTAATDTEDHRLSGVRHARYGGPRPSDSRDAAPDDERREERQEPHSQQDTRLETPRRGDPVGRGVPAWGPYESAVRRWEAIHGPAPRPRDDRGRLNPALPEWMLGFPSGWVTGLDIPRTAQLRLIGNAVQPQVAELAARLLLAPLVETGVAA